MRTYEYYYDGHYVGCIDVYSNPKVCGGISSRTKVRSNLPIRAIAKMLFEENRSTFNHQRIALTEKVAQFAE